MSPNYRFENIIFIVLCQDQKFIKQLCNFQVVHPKLIHDIKSDTGFLYNRYTHTRKPHK